MMVMGRKLSLKSVVIIALLIGLVLVAVLGLVLYRVYFPEKRVERVLEKASENSGGYIQVEVVGWEPGVGELEVVKPGSEDSESFRIVGVEPESVTVALLEKKEPECSVEVREVTSKDGPEWGQVFAVGDILEVRSLTSNLGEGKLSGELEVTSIINQTLRECEKE